MPPPTLFAAVVGAVADVTSAREDPPAEHVKVHPFRAVASAAAHGLAAPEGRHRDGSADRQ
ncbi:2OG-Fe dioxygenase family protein [Nocardia cyriacigeorgica]|uniref:2OG-Fe dioxygenase family protein n=1 Tax=Nocardia cyriacigeorgica TaxID=135487 RepID=UPI0024584C56|nr:2OG-Fe dioxygenase family protein [Nocardia cyriacigeorgica]